MTDSKQIILGIIGLGHWGPNVVRNFLNHHRVKIKYLCDKNVDSFKNITAQLQPNCKMVTDASEIFNDPEVEAVAIVTPASTHYELAKSALIAKKHVFCEKPLTLDIEESKELCQITERLGLRLMVGFTFIYNNGIKALKALKESDRLGQIYYLTTRRTHIGLVRNDVDVVGDLATHDISIMNFLLNSTPETVIASGAKPLGLENHDVAFITLQYPNGVIGHIHVSWVNSNKERVMTMIGSRAMIEFNDLNNLEPVRIYEKGISVSERIEADFGDFRFLLRDGDIISPKLNLKEPLNQMLDAFVRSVLDGDNILTDGKFGMDVTSCLSSIRKSLETGTMQRISYEGI